MKKLFLSLVFLFSYLFSMSQNCIRVQWCYFDNPSGDNINWRLYVNYSADGTKHLNTVVKNNGVQLLNECFETRGNGQVSGTIIYNFTAFGATYSSLSATFSRYTGVCGSGSECDSPQELSNNTLPVKISNLYAKNVGYFTEITFKIESISDKTIVLNFTQNDGTVKKHLIRLPNNAKDGETWKVIINNINNSYLTQKL